MGIRIPRQERQVTPDVGNVPTPQVPAPNRAAFGENLIQAQGQIAEPIARLGDLLVNRARQRQQQENDQNVLNIANDFQQANQKMLFDTETEDVLIDNQQVQRPKGFLNRQGSLAKNSVYEYDKWAKENIIKAVDSIPDVEYRNKLSNLLRNDYQSTKNTILKHEVRQDFLDKKETYANAITIETEKGFLAQDPGNLKRSIESIKVKTDDESNFLGISDANSKDVRRRKNVNLLMQNAVNGSLSQDPTGISAIALLDTVKNDISPEEYNTQKTMIEKTSKSLVSNAQALADRQKAQKGIEVLGGVINGEYGSLDVSKIGQMIANGELDPNTGKAAIKGLTTPIDEFVGETKALDISGLAFIEETKNLLDAQGPQEVEKILVNTLDSLPNTKEGIQNKQLLFGIAKDYAGDKEVRDAFNRILDWQAKSSLTSDQQVKEYFNNVKKGMNRVEALQASIDEEVNRQSSGKTKEKFLDNDISNKIQDHIESTQGQSMTGSVSLNILEVDKGLTSYLMRSGIPYDEAVKQAHDLTNVQGKNPAENADMLVSNIRNALPQLKYDMPKTMEAVEKFKVFHQILDFLNPVSEAYASEGEDVSRIPSEKTPVKADLSADLKTAEEQILERQFASLVASGEGREPKENRALNYAMDVLSGGMTAEEWDDIGQSYIEKIKEYVPDFMLSKADQAKRQIKQDLIDAQGIMARPINSLKEAGKTALDVIGFAFGPTVKGARALGGFIVPEADSPDLKERLQQSIKDVVQDPGAGVYAQRIADDFFRDVKSEGFWREFDIAKIGYLGAITELVTFNPRGIFNSIKEFPIKQQVQRMKEVMAYVEKDLPKIKEALGEVAVVKYGEGKVPSVATKWINELDPVKVVQEAQNNIYFGNYLKAVTDKVVPRFGPGSLSSEMGALRFSLEPGNLKSNLQAVSQYKLPTVVSGVQALKTLMNSGLSKEEIDFSGIDKFLQSKEKFTRKEITDYIEHNKVIIEPVILKGGNIDIAGQEATPSDDAPGEAKYQSYTLPGGENYQETLLTVPGTKTETGTWIARKGAEERIVTTFGEKTKLKKEGWEISESPQQEYQVPLYKSSHWDEPNVLVHHRTNQRTDAQGNKGTFVEEIQSDWHREGKQKGYLVKPKEIGIYKGNNIKQASELATKTEVQIGEGETAYLFDNNSVIIDTGGEVFQVVIEGSEETIDVDSMQEALRTVESSSKIPNAPFKNTWHELALKDIIRQAVERGDKFVAFISGQQTADRYDLSKQVEEVYASNEENGTYEVSVFKKGDLTFFDRRELTKEELPGFLGKDLAEKIIKNDGGKFKGDDLKVGGEWAKKFYDEILPKTAEKYIKKWGSKVEDIKITGVSIGKQAVKYKPNNEVIKALKNNDYLGFDSQREALESILEYKDWAERWEVKGKDALIIDGWREDQVGAIENPTQKGFYITPQMVKEIKEIGQPLFGNRLAGGIGKLSEERGMAGVEDDYPLPDNFEMPPDMLKNMEANLSRRKNESNKYSNLVPPSKLPIKPPITNAMPDEPEDFSNEVSMHNLEKDVNYITFTEPEQVMKLSDKEVKEVFETNFPEEQIESFSVEEMRALLISEINDKFGAEEMERRNKEAENIKKDEIEIPDFKNTEEAIAFGKENKGNQRVIEALKAKRKELQETASNEKDEEKKFTLIQKAQFPREAFEVAEGKGSAAKFEEGRNAKSNGTGFKETGEQAQGLEQGTEGQIRLRDDEKNGMEAEWGTVEPAVNIENLNISETAKTKLKKATEVISDEIKNQTGKPITHEEVLEKAKEADLLTKGSSREKMVEFQAALLKTRQQLAALAEQKELTPEFLDTLRVVANTGTDIASQLQSFRIDAFPEYAAVKTKIIKELMKLGYASEEIIDAGQGVDFTDLQQVTEFYRKFVDPKLSDVLNEFAYINILSSPKTHIVNIFSNLLQTAGLNPITKLATTGVDSVASLLTGKDRQYYLDEISAFYKGALNAIPEASNAVGEALQGKAFIERPDISRIPTNSKFIDYATFGIGKYVPRALEAMDVFFRTMIEKGEIEALTAKYQKQNDGKLPSEKEQVNIEKEARRKAEYYVFRQKPDEANKSGQGDLLSAVDKMTNAVYKLRKVPGARWFVRFVQTPMNILKQGIEYSPAGFATVKGAENKSEQIAKALIGSVLVATSYAVAASGRTTWALPRSKKDREEFYAAGRIPYAVKIGDTWYSYSKLGPLAYPLAIGAAIHYYEKESPTALSDSAIKKASDALAGVMGFFADQSYVRSLGDLIKAIQGEQYKISSLITSVPTQLIPLSSLQRWVNSFTDPLYRDKEKDLSFETIVDNMKSSIVGLSKTIEPKKDSKGKEIKKENVIENALSPIAISKEKPREEMVYKRTVERKQRDSIRNKKYEERRNR